MSAVRRSVLFAALAAAVDAGFYSYEGWTDFYAANWSDPIFLDYTSRVVEPNSTGTCAPGKYIVRDYGTEVHFDINNPRNWAWVDEQACEEQCTYECPGCEFPSDIGTFTCPAEGSGGQQWIHCACEQCECPPGRTGVECNVCTEDAGCGEGSECIRTPAVSTNVPKKWFGEFDQRSEAVYRLLWGEGLAHPFTQVQYNPFTGVLTSEAFQNMCTRDEAAYWFCECTGCDIDGGVKDPVTGDISGECADNGLPTPCVACNDCTCRLPADGRADGFVKLTLENVQGTAYFGCEDSLPLLCTFLLSSFQVPLYMTGIQGMCTPKDVEIVEFKAVPETQSLLDSWVWVGVICLFLTALAALLVALRLWVEEYKNKPRALVEPALPPAPPQPLQDPGQGDVGERQLKLEWRDVTCERGGVQILSKASGSVRTRPSAGAMCAILGESGSGKTTLLDVIAGRAPHDEGSVLLNGASLGAQQRRRTIGYVPQSMVLHRTVTVREALQFSASLRLRGMRAGHRAGRVTWVLQQLELEHLQWKLLGDEEVHGISGGERRRLEIGLELVIAPTVLVLDEPTSGLDAHGSKELGKFLQKLAKQGRIVVSSLHQPRPELLAAFDSCYDVDQGLTQLSASSRAASTGDADQSLTSPSDSPIDARLAVDADVVERGHGGGAAAVSDAKGALEGIRTEYFPAQVWALWLRGFEGPWTSKSWLKTAVLMLILGLGFSLVFRSLGTDVNGTRGRFGALYFQLASLGYYGLQVCISWYSDRPRLQKETAAGYYSVPAYFVAKASAYIFWYCLVQPFLFTIPGYYVIGFSTSHPEKVMTFYLLMCGCAAASSGISLLLISLFASLEAGVMTVGTVLTVMLLYGGLLQPRGSLPSALRWLVDASFFGHAYEALMVNEVSHLTTDFSIAGGTVVPVSGDAWLQQFHFNTEDGAAPGARAVSIIVGVSWLLAFFAVWLQLWTWEWPRRAVQFGEACGKVVSDRLKGLRESLPCCGGAKPKEPWVADVLQEPTNSITELAWENVSAFLPEASGKEVTAAAPAAEEAAGANGAAPSRPGRALLSALRGRARAGRPLMVVGPSGCGKSTLLGILAGDGLPNGVEAERRLLVDGAPVGRLGELRRRVSYARQDDVLFALITVRESLSFAAALHCRDISVSERHARVEWMLQQLGLESVADSYIGGERRRGISGGERRRTAIAVELIAMRPILILDEPTTGLDSKNASKVADMLKAMAAKKRIVICSLHQPESGLLKCFSDTLALTPQGGVAYAGPVDGLRERLASAQVPLPSGGEENLADLLLDAVYEQRHRERLLEEQRRPEESDDLAGAQAEVAAEAGQPPSSSCLDRALRWLRGLKTLITRDLLITWREPSLFTQQLLLSFAMALLLGFTYRPLPETLQGVIGRSGLFASVSSVLGIQALMTLVTWRKSHVAFLREFDAGMYEAGGYVVSKAIVDSLVLRIGPAILLALVMSRIACLDSDAEPFLVLVVVLTSMAASMLCLALGSFMPKSSNLLPFVALVMLIYLLFGGIFVPDPPAVMTTISFFYGTYHALLSNELAGGNFTIDPEGYEGSFGETSGDDLLEWLEVNGDNKGLHVFQIVAWTIGYIFIAYGALSLHARSCRVRRHFPRS